MVVAVRLRRRRSKRGCAGGVGGCRRAKTVGRADGGGARWTRARCGPTSRPTLPGAVHCSKSAIEQLMRIALADSGGDRRAGVRRRACPARPAGRAAPYRNRPDLLGTRRPRVRRHDTVRRRLVHPGAVAAGVVVVRASTVVAPLIGILLAVAEPAVRIPAVSCVGFVGRDHPPATPCTCGPMQQRTPRESTPRVGLDRGA